MDEQARAGAPGAFPRWSLQQGLDPLHLPPYIQKLFNKPGEPHEGA
jgi:hypothetical protein